MSDQPVILKASHIRKQFLRQGKDTNVFHAVQDTDLTLYAGELTVLKGRSGSGKTTLLNMLAGLLQPTDGSVSVFPPGQKPDAVDLYALDDEARARVRNRAFGVIPQGNSAIGSLTVSENILLPYTLYGDPLPDETRTDDILTRLGIVHLKREMPVALSGGELKRMAVARALLRHPLILFADEPTADLDDESTQTVFTLFREAADAGCAVFIVTHEDISGVRTDRLYHMDAGHLMI
ncbi:MAG: ATP-binding cassette domain-containing protein [Lachnospiraceae bacterium]|nr:ATP-binding cassette domain-containing protein [Lachnospiraceae bacterium]